MGFCLFNNVAIAARAFAASRGGDARVLIVDFDYHHGNGTEAIAGQRPLLRFDARLSRVSGHRRAQLSDRKGSRRKRSAARIGRLHRSLRRALAVSAPDARAYRSPRAAHCQRGLRLRRRRQRRRPRSRRRSRRADRRSDCGYCGGILRRSGCLRARGRLRHRCSDALDCRDRRCPRRRENAVSRSARYFKRYQARVARLFRSPKEAYNEMRNGSGVTGEPPFANRCLLATQEVCR